MNVLELCFWGQGSFCFNYRMCSQCSRELECNCCRTKEGTYQEFPLKEESATFLSGETSVFVLREEHMSWNSPEQLYCACYWITQFILEDFLTV